MFWAVQSAASSKWFDQSHDIFLPPALNSLAASYRDFPLFWWNFLIIEGPVAPADLESLCTELAVDPTHALQKLPCHFDLAQLKVMTQDWLRDLPRRRDRPPEAEFSRRLEETLGKASLPMGRGLVDLLRADPLDSLRDLKMRVEKRMQMDLKLEHGFLVDAQSERKLIPVQFSFSPADSARTQGFVDTLPARCAARPGCRALSLFGPHASTRENETQIRADVDIVSVVGLAALALLCGFILVTRRARMLCLVPMLIFSIAVAVAVTVWVFGKIHGITLAFGPGIVGLSMDYGIHACFLGPDSRKTWRANLVGLFTTIIIMILLGFSQIPLLRQMMFFATFGLCFNYLIFYLVMRRWPAWFACDYYRLKAQTFAPMRLLAVPLMIGSLGLFFLPIELDVQHLNFESAKTVELRRWFFKVAGLGSPYLVEETPTAPLVSSSAAAAFAAERGFSYEGLANYLPPPAKQEAHLSSWRAGECPTPRTLRTPTEAKFFAPFWDYVACSELNANDLLKRVPDYLHDFHHDGHFVGLFFPRDDAQVAELRARYPQASTPREVFARFPQIFLHELTWMVPLALLGAFFFLWLHYRQLGWASLAVVPFLTGAGCFALVAAVFQLPVSFISLIGLLMVFGCSLDYGVFVMDFLLYRDEDRPGVWSALSLCCFATIAGFAPLVFARHPVLNDLGQALLWGTLGTYLGSVWGIPFVYQRWARWRQGALP